MPVFSAEHCGLHLEFLNGVKRGLQIQRAVIRVDVRGAVQQEIGIVRAAARDAEPGHQSLPELILLHGPATRVGTGHQ